MTPPVRVDASFWSAFAARHWEARPWVADAIVDVSIPRDPAALFDAIVALAERCPANRRERLIQVYVAGRRLDARQAEPLLPRRDDASLEGYDARLQESLRGAEYLLRMEKLHAFYAPYWEGAYRWVRAVAREVGLAPGADTSVFLGRYRFTPTGVHYDNLSSFNFPVVGTKSMRVWPREYVAAHPDLDGAREYARHLGGSELLRAPVGGMIYWPSSAFHIGEGDDGFTATLGIGIWIDKRPLGMVLELLGNAVAAAHPEVTRPLRVYDVDVDDPQAAATALPPALEGLVAAVERLVARGALRDAVLDTWLETLTDVNLKRLAPDPIELPVADDARVIVDPAHPIVWSRRTGGGMVAAARGLLVELRGDRDPAVIAALGVGAASTVDELASRAGVPAGEVRVLVAALVRAGLAQLA